MDRKGIERSRMKEDEENSAIRLEWNRNLMEKQYFSTMNSLYLNKNTQILLLFIGKLQTILVEKRLIT